MCATDCYNMTGAVKVALSPNTTNHNDDSTKKKPLEFVIRTSRTLDNSCKDNWYEQGFKPKTPPTSSPLRLQSEPVAWLQHTKLTIEGFSRCPQKALHSRHEIKD